MIVFDSMEKRYGSSVIVTHMLPIRYLLMMYWLELKKDTSEANPVYFSEDKMPIVYGKGPQQENPYDCGLFAVMNSILCCLVREIFIY